MPRPLHHTPARVATPSPPDPSCFADLKLQAQDLDLELSALVYLLARAAQAPQDATGSLLALCYLERVAAQSDTPPLMRRTTRHLARCWRRGELGPVPTDGPAGQAPGGVAAGPVVAPAAAPAAGTH